MKAPDPVAAFSREVGAQETRKLAARRLGLQAVWSGFGMFGLIGWSVAAPTVLGALAGMWLDKRHADTHSWTIALLVAGLCLGCFNAWHWVAKEEEQMNAGEERDD
jgi:ATP synthase protein I